MREHTKRGAGCVMALGNNDAQFLQADGVPYEQSSANMAIRKCYSFRMNSRYDPSDLLVYGAEDDEEMDMILCALDKAMDDEFDGATKLSRDGK